MILADTSIWIDHFRQPDRSLVGLLKGQQIVTHSFVIGEISLGNLRNRREIIALLRGLHACIRVSDELVHAIG